MCVFFFFNDTATTEIYTLYLHDALPIFTFRFDWISSRVSRSPSTRVCTIEERSVSSGSRSSRSSSGAIVSSMVQDRKSTRLNSSHLVISYAVFCLKKKHTHSEQTTPLRV